ncbi:MAG: FtsX-like permease family protein [Promethearchaeota archaeon]
MTWKLLKGNFKTLLLIIISLSFICTTIVSFCIILDSNNSTLFKATQNKLHENYEYHLKLEILYQLDYLSYQVTTNDQILSDIDSHLATTEMINYLNGSWIEPRIPFFNRNATKGFQYGHVYYFEDDRGELIDNFLIPGSRLPQHENETLLVIRNDTRMKFEINSSYYFSSISQGSSSFPLTVVGILYLLEHNQFSSYKSYINYITNIRISTGINLGNDLYALIVKKTDYSPLIKRIGESSPENPSEQSTLDIFLRFDSYKFKVFESNLYINRLEVFRGNIVGLYDCYDYLKEELQTFHQHWFDLLVEFLLLALPVFIISFYLTNFVVNNTNLPRLRRYHALFLRGLSFKQIIFILFLESAISFVGIISSGVLFGSILGSVIVIYLDGVSSLFINFTNWIFYPFLVIMISNGLVYVKIAVKIKAIFQKEGISPIDFSENVQIHSWPFKLLISGTSLLILSYLVITLDIPLWSQPAIISAGFEQIIRLIIIISLLGLSIGLIFSLRPIFCVFVSFISDKMWKKYYYAPVLALKNIKRFIRTFSDVWLFLTLLIFYSFILMTLTSSTEHHLREQAEFSVGADYQVGFTEINEEPLTDFLTMNLSEKVSFTKVIVANMFYKREAGEAGGTESTPDLNLLGIDPESFFEIAYHNPQTKFTPSITDFQENLQKNNNSVSVSRGFLQYESLSVNNEFPLYLLAFNASWHIPEFHHPITNVTIKSSFKLYPLIANNPYDRAMIIHQKFLEGLDEISEDPTSITMKHFFLLKSSERISTDIIKILENKYSAEVRSTHEVLNRFKLDRSWKHYLSSQQTVIIISLMLALGCFILFGLFQRNNRVREHAIERTLGLTRGEVLHVVLYEEIIVIFLAIVSGVGTGIFSSSLFFFFQSALWNVSAIYQTVGLSPSIIFPIDDILYYITWFIVFMFISVVPSILIHRKFDVASLLKRFE